MRDRLPDTIDPASLTPAGREYHGPLSVSGMTRLADVLHDAETPDLDVRLFAARDGSGVRFVEGQVNGCLHLTCQRCLDRLVWPLRLDLQLALVSSEGEADRLAGEYNPVLLDADRVQIRTLIEDEILLALPDFPHHAEHEACTPPDYRDEAPGEDQDATPNPFAVLEKLKQH